MLGREFQFFAGEGAIIGPFEVVGKVRALAKLRNLSPENVYSQTLHFACDFRLLHLKLGEM